ncbi:MAG TPA: SIMPL domain-containing protein [Caldimonas sp.]|jgi:predicted secreted protein|nr:SIMPL domain-containing protein [Caldimonas sp.]HEX2541735.1 SIMPL domain-containing protein [Caldimonas sp.]
MNWTQRSPALALWTLFVAASWPIAARAQAVPGQPVEGVLGLSAQASLEVTKDLLAITFSTSRQGPDANAVQAQLKQALEGALAEARKVARPGQVEVQTGNFSLYPRYAGGSGTTAPTLAGWQGSAEIVVEGRDMAAIGQLAGRITTMTVARVAHRLSRQASQRVEGELAAEAIGRYRVKAAEYARQFGYGGYTIREVSVATSEPHDGPVPMMRMQAAGAAPPGDALSVEPGKAVVTATVNGTVQMK